MSYFDLFQNTFRIPTLPWAKPSPSLIWITLAFPFHPIQTLLNTVARKVCKTQGRSCPSAQNQVVSPLLMPNRSKLTIALKILHFLAPLILLVISPTSLPFPLCCFSPTGSLTAPWTLGIPYSLASGPLHWLYPLPGMISLQIVIHSLRPFLAHTI